MLTMWDTRASIMSELWHQGAALLKSAFEPSALLAEAMEYTLVGQAEYYGTRRVRQQISSSPVESQGSIDRFADVLESQILSLLGQRAFEGGLHFNARNVQYYQDGSYGIDLHKDESSNRNLIVLCELSGMARFKIAYSIDGPECFFYEMEPGDILLMLAPGFMGLNERPVHGVDRIRGERYVVGLRQSKSKEE